MKRFRNHFVFWLAYVIFKTYLNVSSLADPTLNDQFVSLEIQLIFLIPQIPLVYLSFYAIDQHLSGRWSLWKLLVLLIVSLAAAAAIMPLLTHHVVLPWILDVYSEKPTFGTGSMMYHFFSMAFVTGVAVSIRLFRRQYQFKLRETELRKEKIAAELKYLKSQLNPHFLFNTLNNIYSLARKKSDQTSEAILKLSKLMRFMLFETSNPSILLTEELMVIRDYIELEKLRYSERLTVSYREDIDNQNQHIAPLMLTHFVENAFKHGASESRHDSYISIEIILKNSILHARIMNSKIDQPNEERDHIGMKNINRQLELIYPSHELKIISEPDTYTVNLTIPLNS